MTIEEQIKRLETITSRNDISSGTSISDQEREKKLDSIDAYYKTTFLPQQASAWAKEMTEFQKKISADAQARSKGYQSPDALKAYQDSISGQLNDLISRSRYATEYADISGDRNYIKSINDSVSYLTGINSSLKHEQDYWSQWADENAYKASPNYFVNEYGDATKKYNGGTLFNTGLHTPGQNVANNRDIYEAIMGVKEGSYWDNLYMQGGAGYDYLNRSSAVSAINKEEADMYWYLHDNVSKEEADRYYKSISAHLAERAASENSAELMKMAGDNQFLKDTLATLYSVPSGFSSALTGIGNATLLPFGKTVAPDVAGKTHQYNREQLSDVGGVIADLGQTTGNMLPSIAVSTVSGSPLLGAGITAMSSGGNAYAETLAQGYTRGQATLYGIVNGVLEGGLQYALGGIGKLGGKLSGKLTSKIGSKILPYFNNIKSAAARTALSAGGQLLARMGSEATEEYLQAVLDPLVRNITLQEDNDFWGNIFSEDTLYSAMLGALSAGLWEGGSVITNTAQANSVGKRAFENGSWQGAVDYALVLDPNSEPYKIAKGLQDGSIIADGNNVGRLYSALVEYMQESKKLVRKGKMTTDQYVSAQSAIEQIYNARTTAESQNNTDTGIAPDIMDANLYQEIKSLGLDEKTATKYTNAITNLKNGTEVSAKITNELISGTSPVKDIVSRELGIDTTNKTTSELRNAVKSYVETVKSQPKTEVAEQTAPKSEKEVQYEQTKTTTAELSKVLGEAGQAVYNTYSEQMGSGNSLLYFNNALFDFYNQGVEESLKKNPAKKYTDIKGYEGIAPAIKQRAFEAGKIDNKAKAEAFKKTEAKVKEETKEIKKRQKETKSVKFDVKDLAPSAGEWTVDEGVDIDNLNAKQNAAFNYLKAVSEVSGINVHIMSGINKKGELTTENGFYDHETNTVYVSINAGAQSLTDITNTAVLKTASHEITHYIAATDTDAYQELRDYVVETFKKEHGEDGLARRISEIQDIYLDQINKELTYEKAVEEMVANACETMLRNSKVFEQLARQNMTLAERLKAGLDSFVSKMAQNRKTAFENVDETSLEARIIAQSEKSLKKTQELWDNALKAAIKKNQEADVKTESEGKMSEVRNKNTRQNVAENVSYLNSNKGGQNDGTNRRNESGISGNRTRGQKNSNITTNENGRNQGIHQRFYRPLRQVDSKWQNLTATQRTYAQKIIDNLIMGNSYAERIFDAKGLDAYKIIYDDILSDSPIILDSEAKQKLVEISQQNYRKYANAPTAEDNEYLQLTQQYLANKNKASYEKLAKMVLKAADNAGYTTDGYHGTNAEFYEFVFGDIGFHIGTEEQAHARAILQEGDRIIHLRGKFDNPLYIDMDFGDWHGKNVAEMLLETKRFDGHSNQKSIEAELNRIKKMRNQDEADEAMRKLLLEHNYDSVKYINTQDVEGKNDFSYIALKSSQLKSAEPIVYDDGGNIVPLSQRFNNADRDIRFSLRLPDNAEALAKKHFGRTARWTETGYLTTDGTPLDFSGRHWSPDHKDDRMFINSRQVDHTDIQEVFPNAEGYRKAQFAFVARGNIRIVPETAGIILAVKPTEKQASMLKGYFTAMKASRDIDTLLVDIDDANGKTVKTLEYPKSTSPTRIINDINAYFDGKEVQSVSDVARFHTMYNLRYDKLETGIYKDADGNEIAVIGERVVGRRTKDIKRVLDAEIKKHIGQTYEIGDCGELVYIDSLGASEYAGSNYTNKLPNKKLVTKTNATPMIENVLKVAKFVNHDIDHKPTQRNHGARSKNGFNYYTTKFAVPMLDDNQNIAGYNVYNAQIIAAVGQDRKLRLHDLDEIKADRDRPVIKQSGIHRISANDDNISQPSDVVNKDFSLRYDETEFNARRELSTALMDIAQTDAERKSLEIYQKNVKMLNEQEELLGKMKQRLTKIDKKTNAERYAELQKNIRGVENKINYYDSKLVNLEATKPIKDIIARREERLKEQFARSSTTRAKYRNNIKKNIRSLDQKLRTNSGEKHILKDFQPVVAQLLDVFTNNTSVFKADQLEKLHTIYNKFKPNSDKEIELGNESEVYENEDIENDPTAYMAYYAPVIEKTIKTIAPIVENKRLIELDAETLAALDNVISNIHKMIVHADDIFVSNRTASIREISEGSMKDMKNSGFTPGKTQEGGKIASAKEFFEYKNALPVYVMERLGDTVMEYLWTPLEKASAQMIREQVTDTDFLQGKMKQYGYESWKNDAKRITLESGQTITITDEIAMYIYAVSKREASHRGIDGKQINHLGKGGIVLPKIVTELVKDENGKVEKYLGIIPKTHKTFRESDRGVPLTDTDISKIAKALTENQRRYVDDVVKYLSTTIADRGNATSQKLYGIDLFNEEYYIPLMSKQDYLNISFMGQTDRLIKNAGMTKSLTAKASNPIVVDDFTSVVARHLLQMERYDTLAVPLDNFNRWLNYLSRTEDSHGNIVKNGDGVRVTINSIYGAEMKSYITQLLRDANASSTTASNESIGAALLGKFRKNAVLASMSVAIQQPSAMARVLAYMSPKYIAFRTGWTNYRENYEELLKYSDTAFVKEHGSFDPAVSTSALEDMLYLEPEGWQKLTKLFTDSKHRDEVLSALPKMMDRITWIRIWQAVKAETADLHPDLAKGSEEFLKVAGERFDYIVNRTQVYDSVLSKSELMRSKGTWTKVITSFSAEPTVSYNMLMKGAQQVVMAKGTDKSIAWRFFGRTVGAFTYAALVNAFLKSLVTAARKDKPDDKDDKSYIEWYAQEVLGNFLSDVNPLGLLPIVRDAVSLFEGYDLSRTDMEAIKMMADAVDAIADQDMPIEQKLGEIVKAIGIVIGVPVENIMRDFEALINVFVDIFNGWDTSWQGIGDAMQDAIAGLSRFEIVEESGNTADKLYSAMMNGDTSAYKQYYADIVEEFNKKKQEGKTDFKNAESYIRSQMRKRLVDSAEIKAAYEASEVSDFAAYDAAFKALTDKGFHPNDIMDAIRSYEKKVKDAESEPSAEEYEEESVRIDRDLLADAIANGKELEVIAEEQNKYKKGSQEYKDNAAKIKRYITEELKPQYQDAYIAKDVNTVAAIYRRLKSYSIYGIVYDDNTIKKWRESAVEDRA